jgi:hypothetical protein
MTEWENIEENAKKAFENNEFYEFLTGRNGYAFLYPFLNANVPTDWTCIIPYGIYKLYEDTKDDKIIDAYIEAINKTINGDSTDLWMATYILFNQFANQKRGEAPFNIDEDILINFNIKLKEKKEELENNTNYGGKGWSNGLYGDIERLNWILEKDYSISLIR